MKRGPFAARRDDELPPDQTVGALLYGSALAARRVFGRIPFSRQVLRGDGQWENRVVDEAAEPEVGERQEQDPAKESHLL